MSKRNYGLLKDYPSLPRPKPQRLGIRDSAARLKNLGTEQLPWYESAEEVRRAWENAERRHFRLKWIRRRMQTDLTPFERWSILLVYFRAKTYREAAQQLGASRSAVYRATRRGIRKIRRKVSRYRGP